MGESLSKMSVPNMDTIELNTVNLIFRIGEEEGKIDQQVKTQISEALSLYSDLLPSKEGKEYITQRKTDRSKEIISQAQKRLEPVATTNVIQSEKHQKYDKLFAFNLEQHLNKKETIKEKRYLETINALRAYMEKERSEEQKKKISMLFLRVFLKSQPTKATDILEKTLSDLEESQKNFDQLDVKSVNGFVAQEVRTRLAKVLNLTAKLQQKVEGRITEWDQYWTDSLQDNINKQVEEDLNQYKAIIENLYPPVGEIIVESIEKKISILTDRMKDSEMKLKSSSTDRIQEVETKLKQSITEIKKKLNQIREENSNMRQHINILQESEAKISSIIESDEGLLDKINKVIEAAKMLDQVNTTNTEVNIRKSQIVNTKNAFLTAASMNYLRQMKMKMDYFKRYVQEFPYPEEADLYKTKRNEIESFEKELQRVPKSIDCVNKRIEFIQEQLKEILETFDSRVKNNQKIFSAVKELEKISEKISKYEKTSQGDLQIFNSIRKEINSVGNFNRRLCKEKIEIIRRLHLLEERVYPEEHKHAKNQLNRYENEVYQSQDLNYQDKLKEISNLKTQAKNVSFFYENVDSVIEILRSLDKEIQDSNVCIKQLRRIEEDVKDLPTSNTLKDNLQLLIQDEGKLKVMRQTPRKNADLTKIEKTETLITEQKFKLQLKQLTSELPELQINNFDSTVPMDTEAFQDKINAIFFWKETIEDIPDDGSELNPQKKESLQTLVKILKTLDPHVQKYISRCPDNILDLHSYFKGSNVNENEPRDSVEFIDKIHQRAESFALYVNFFLGKSSCMDFYIIHENLMRLLGELDKIPGNSGLLQHAVDAINYIKELIETLELNASDGFTVEQKQQQEEDLDG